MTIGSKMAGAFAMLVMTAGGVTCAAAKSADCFTSDDGNYSCNFRGTDQAGSFRASAPGYPTITLEVASPGVAYVLKNFGDGNVSLPGPYYRSDDDRACWDNPDTGDRSASGSGADGFSWHAMRCKAPRPPENSREDGWDVGLSP